MKRTIPLRSADFLSSALTCLALVLALGAGGTLRAAKFSHGELRGSFDSTFSFGAIYRLDDPDRTYFGVANGGLANSVNADDGNLNYRRGWASWAAKGTHDLELQYGDHLGAFARVTYFFDFENQDGDRARTPLSKEAKERVGRRIDYLDLYGLWRGEIGGRDVDIRFGRQVLNLGESTFIPNGINIVNPVDISRLRTPGAELREALLPVTMLKGNIALTPTLTVEPFWMLEFRRVEIDPAGTYFSNNDFISRGAKNVYLGFGALSDLTPLGAIPRDRDREGNNFSQAGISARWLAANLNDTEFGLYYARYHSRLPVISARTPTTPINTDLTGPLTQVFIRAGLPAATAAAQAAGIFQLIVLSQTNPAALTPVQLATLQAAQTQQAIAGARQIALLSAAATGRYFVEYPEDLNLVGVSFNTDIATTGVALQGEISLKGDVPLQIDDVELLFATLSALNPAFGANNQIGNYLGQLGREISGYRRLDVWTAQATATKVFGPMLGASQMTLLGEVGGVYVPDLPDRNILRFDVNGTFTSGSQAAMVGTGSTLPATPLSQFADRFSWGYQALARLDYNNLFAGVNVSPSIALAHDVSGNTPNPVGNFLEGRKSLNLAVEFVWQNKWSTELRYVGFFGGGAQNLIADRDYVAATVKYSF
jgi:hypothetical protein